MQVLPGHPLADPKDETEKDKPMSQQRREQSPRQGSQCLPLCVCLSISGAPAPRPPPAWRPPSPRDSRSEGITDL